MGRTDTPAAPTVRRKLEVENGLCGETRYRRRANVIQAGDDCAESTTDPTKLALGQAHPGGVVIHDHDRWIEAVIERPVPLELLLVGRLAWPARVHAASLLTRLTISPSCRFGRRAASRSVGVKERPFGC